MSLALLWQLQNLYLEKQALEQSIDNNEGKVLHEEKEQILAALMALEETEKNLKQKQRCLKQLEDTIADSGAKLKAAEEHLYSGEVKNSKELTNIEQQVRQLKDDLDRGELEFLVQAEKLEQELDGSQQQRRSIAGQKKAYKAKVEEYLKRKKQLEEGISGKDQEIRDLKGAIEQKLLDLYLDQTERLGFNVLSRIEGKICSACHMIIPALLIKEAKQGKTLVNCENCGRILFWNRNN